MKKWSLLIAVIFTASLILAACSGTGQKDQELPVGGNGAQQQADDNNGQIDPGGDGDQASLSDPPVAEPLPEDVPELLPEDHNSDVGSDGESAGPAARSYTVDQLSEQLAIGMSKAEVVEIIGEHYTAVTIAMDNAEGWRYDMDTVDGYSFTETLDNVDIEGMKRGDILQQIFIQFDNDSKVNGYSAYQANDDGSITVYQWLENGEMLTDTIL